MLNYYDRVRLIWNADLTEQESHLLHALNSFVDGNGECFPGQERLAYMMNCKVRTVRDRCLKLEKRGIIERSRREKANGARTSDLYKVCFEKIPQKPPYKPSKFLPEDFADPPAKLSGTQVNVPESFADVPENHDRCTGKSLQSVPEKFAGDLSRGSIQRIYPEETHPRPQNFELEADASTLGTSHQENENEKVSTNEMDNTCIIGENLEEQKFNSGGAAVVQMSAPVVQVSPRQQYETEWKKLPKRGKSIDSRSAPFKSWVEQWGEVWSKDWKDDWETMTPDVWVKAHFDKWFKIEIWVPYPNYKNRKKNQESAIARLKKAILDKSSDPRMIVRRLEYDMSSSWEGDRIQYVQQPDVWANARAWLEDNGWDEPPDPFAHMDPSRRRSLEQLPEPKAYCERLSRANYLVTYDCPPDTHPMLGTVFDQKNNRYYIYERFVKAVAPPSLLEFLEKISNTTQI